MNPEVQQKIIELLKVPQLSNLATVTLDGKPWTRYVMINSDNEFNLRSAVCINSRKVKQIENNPEVHVTFGINDPADLSKPYVQIQGKARITTDRKEKNDYWFDMLSAVFSGPDDPNYSVLVIEPYRAEFMNPGSMSPEIWEKEFR
ncbi:MAG TPA: pyridoxamine 5'-phosphate oxidase family protein [bacterium]|nr:pyridoxamine 5'-phosphate oxidase family protein [bacterium]HPJ72964.1 pyridoxamine 5'-phosphate oxidase family protein [bacterium]HPQ66669.1 pyridoxamine 5'-phosphate oxidase family protein [bacterium]